MLSVRIATSASTCIMCTCIDSLVKGAMCKHIHKACQWNSHGFQPVVLERPSTAVDSVQVFSLIQTATIDKAASTSIDSKCRDQISLLQQQLIDSNSNEGIIAVHQKLKEACNILKIHSSRTVNVNIENVAETNVYTPSNKKLLTQRPSSFYKTRKKRDTSSRKIRIKKPTSDEKQGIKGASQGRYKILNCYNQASDMTH